MGQKNLSFQISAVSMFNANEILTWSNTKKTAISSQKLKIDMKTGKRNLAIMFIKM